MCSWTDHQPLHVSSSCNQAYKLISQPPDFCFLKQSVEFLSGDHQPLSTLHVTERRQSLNCSPPLKDLTLKLFIFYVKCNYIIWMSCNQTVQRKEANYGSLMAESKSFVQQTSREESSSTFIFYSNNHHYQFPSAPSVTIQENYLAYKSWYNHSSQIARFGLIFTICFGHASKIRFW